MTTANVKTPFHQPQNFAELADLEEKVRATKTYQNAWFVKRTITRGGLKAGYETTQLIQLENLSKEDAEDVAASMNKAAEHYIGGNINSITFQVGNIFENYQQYIDGGGKENPRAARWNEIKWITFGLVHADPKEWD